MLAVGAWRLDVDRHRRWLAADPGPAIVWAVVLGEFYKKAVQLLPLLASVWLNNLCSQSGEAKTTLPLAEAPGSATKAAGKRQY